MPIQTVGADNETGEFAGVVESRLAARFGEKLEAHPGAVSRARRVTVSEFAALATKHPTTVYFIVADPA